MNSILTSVKKLLGLAEDNECFDTDITIHINSVFNILTQLGAGPENGFSITGKEETWSDYMDDNACLEMVKTYVFLKVRMLFDPPLNSSVSASIEKQIAELEWRMEADHEQRLLNTADNTFEKESEVNPEWTI